MRNYLSFGLLLQLPRATSIWLPDIMERDQHIQNILSNGVEGWRVEDWWPLRNDVGGGEGQWTRLLCALVGSDGASYILATVDVHVERGTAGICRKVLALSIYRPDKIDISPSGKYRPDGIFSSGEYLQVSFYDSTMRSARFIVAFKADQMLHFYPQELDAAVKRVPAGGVWFGEEELRSRPWMRIQENALLSTLIAGMT